MQGKESYHTCWYDHACDSSWTQTSNMLRRAHGHTSRISTTEAMRVKGQTAGLFSPGPFPLSTNLPASDPRCACLGLALCATFTPLIALNFYGTVKEKKVAQPATSHSLLPMVPIPADCSPLFNSFLAENLLLM